MGRKEPLLRFGVFDQVHVPPASAFKGDYHLAAFKPEWDFQTYKQAFDIMRRFLQSGDIYQANLTFPMAAAYKGCLVRLYERLKQKQPVPFGAFVDLGGAKLLCRSPELFFSL